jgi:hypothetical protein
MEMMAQSRVVEMEAPVGEWIAAGLEVDVHDLVQRLAVTKGDVRGGRYGGQIDIQAA